MTSQEQEMVRRCARAMQASKAWPAVFDAGTAEVLALAAIEAITSSAVAEYRITTADGDLFAETSGPREAALKEAYFYAMQEPGSVIEQVVCLPVSTPSKGEE